MNSQSPWWTKKFSDAEIFDDEESALMRLKWMRYAMEQHLGYDLKTKKPIKDVGQGTPLHRIDIPYWAFNLLGLTIQPEQEKLEGTASVYVMEIKLAISEHFIEFEGKYPTE